MGISGSGESERITFCMHVVHLFTALVHNTQRDTVPLLCYENNAAAGECFSSNSSALTCAMRLISLVQRSRLD